MNDVEFANINELISSSEDRISLQIENVEAQLDIIAAAIGVNTRWFEVDRGASSSSGVPLLHPKSQSKDKLDIGNLRSAIGHYPSGS